MNYIIQSGRPLAAAIFFTMMHVFSPAQAATAPEPGEASLAALNLELRALRNHPARALASLAVVAIREGRIVYAGHFGDRVIDAANPANNLPADAQTLYRVASISKLVTAIGAMQLVEQHKLDLDADVSQYLGFTLRNPNFPDALISARMLLSHTSSLRDEGGYSFPVGQSLQSVLVPAGANYGSGRQWAQKSRVSDRSPGRYFEYVNLNWGVLGTVIEALSGQRFDHYMKRAVLGPLRIAGGFNPDDFSGDEIQNLAVLYRKRTHEVWDPCGPWVAQVDDYRGRLPAPGAAIAAYSPGQNATPLSPQGGLRISAAGLAQLMLMLINGGELEGVRLLSPASVNAMLQEEWRHAKGMENGNNYRGLFNAWGLGLQKFLDLSGPQRGDRFVAAGGVTGFGHLGFAYGLQSAFIFDPVKRFGLIYLGGGVGFDPELDAGRYSSLNSWEEKVLDALYRQAILGP